MYDMRMYNDLFCLGFPSCELRILCFLFLLVCLLHLDLQVLPALAVIDMCMGSGYSDTAGLC